MQHVPMFSGGVGSWATARIVREDYVRPGEQLTLLFADTLMEDEDLYRFLDEAAADIGGDLVRIDQGKDPWDVFFERRFIGNTRIDPCSYYLKRKPMRAWLEANCDPADTAIYLGIDWTEADRYHKAKKYWEPWNVYAPLIHDRLLDKDQQLAWLAECGIAPPRLYAMGFPHNNCGGFCIKAGQGHFKNLLEQMPERYAYHEQRERELRADLGKDVAILRDRRGGVTKPLPLFVLREMQGVDEYDIGGCNCVNPDEEVDAACEGLPVVQ